MVNEDERKNRVEYASEYLGEAAREVKEYYKKCAEEDNFNCIVIPCEKCGTQFPTTTERSNRYRICVDCLKENSEKPVYYQQFLDSLAKAKKDQEILSKSKPDRANITKAELEKLLYYLEEAMKLAKSPINCYYGFHDEELFLDQLQQRMEEEK